MPRPSRAARHEPAGETDAPSLPEAFRAVSHRLRGLSMQTLAPFDLTPAQARALMVLARGGDMRLRALSDRLRIAARSATEFADALESRGLVERLPDPTDRRATLLQLTAAGTDLVGRIRAAGAAEAEALFGSLTGAERAELARILAKLRD